MRQLRRILRLHHEGNSTRDIVRVTGIARTTVQRALERSKAADLVWPLADDVSDEVLEERLYAGSGKSVGFGAGVRKRQEPDWADLVRELRRPAVTMVILWEEYRKIWPDGYAYSRFCELLREFQQRLSPVMRQHHVAGDKLFVDYSGKRQEICDPLTGEVRMAEIFVAVLGASNYTFAEVTWSQTLPDWIGSHVRLFRHIGGVTRLLVPDNLKSGVNKASFYDPEINRSYGRMTEHYAVGVLPARPKKPKDKAAVEAGVRFAQTYILGRLRNQTFFSLDEANAAVAVAMTDMNTRPMRKLGVSRADLLESLDRPALKRLPDAEYEYAEWKLVRVGIDYHVEIDKFYYSVPHALMRQQVDARITTGTIELFHKGKRVAAHQRRYGSARRHGTLPESQAAVFTHGLGARAFTKPSIPTGTSGATFSMSTTSSSACSCRCSYTAKTTRTCQSWGLRALGLKPQLPTNKKPITTSRLSWLPYENISIRPTWWTETKRRPRSVKIKSRGQRATLTALCHDSKNC